jgi:hypothetical protein
MAGAPSKRVAHLRARRAALSRDRAADDPEFVAAARDLAAEKLAEYVKRIVDEAPPLTEAQRARIAAILAVSA